METVTQGGYSVSGEGKKSKRKSVDVQLSRNYIRMNDMLRTALPTALKGLASLGSRSRF